MSATMSPTVVMRRYALTGLNALDAFDAESHPLLRHAEGVRAIDEYNAALERVHQVAHLAALDDSEITRDYRVVQARLNERLRTQARALTVCGQRFAVDTHVDLSRLPGYLQAASDEVHAALDDMEDEIIYSPFALASARTAAASGDAGTLRDVVEEILDTARGARKTFSREFVIPAAFRDMLRTDAAMKEVARVLPPFTALQKRRLRRTYLEEALDLWAPSLTARDYSTAYSKAMSTYTNALKNGVLRGGGAATVRLKDKPPKNKLSGEEIVLGSFEDANVKWTIVYRLVARTAQAVEFRFSFKAKAITRIVKAWVKNAMSMMEESAENPAAEMGFRVEQLDDSLRHGSNKIAHSWGKGSAHASASLAEDGTVNVQLDLTKTTEMKLLKDPDDRQKQLLQMHGINRAQMGTRAVAERAAKQVSNSVGATVSAVQELRERSSDLHTNGFRFFFNVPPEAKPQRVLRMLTDLAWKIGKGPQGEDTDATEQMQKFEKEFGVATTRAQSAKVSRALIQRKLGRRIDDLLKRSDVTLSRGMREQLGRLKWGLDNQAIQDMNALVITLPARIEMIEERFTRKASIREARVVGGPVMDLHRLTGYLQRTVSGFSLAVQERVAGHGVDADKIPDRDALINMLTAQAKRDADKYGVNGYDFVLHIPHGTPTETAERLAHVTSGGIELTLANVNKMLVVRASLTRELRERLAA